MPRPRTPDRAVRSPFITDRRGSFRLRLPTGRILSFKDAAHRADCIHGMNSRRFAHLGELVDYCLASPNGFTAFLSE